MRTAVSLLGFVAILGTASVAVAQKKGKADDKGAGLVGSYDVRYEEVSSNCSQTSITLNRGTIDISKKKNQLVVDIERFPLMTGSPQRGGKLRAASKIAPSSIEGVDGKFSVAGRVDEGLISLVFVAEYYVEGKPLCSQTWNVSGQKSAKAARQDSDGNGTKADVAPEQAPRTTKAKRPVKKPRARRQKQLHRA